ncbi:MAG: hypothetical protein OXI49_11900 [Acidobacteriota bacterium]|nr:hypothetical protein [Acidobacteriota bacterium]
MIRALRRRHRLVWTVLFPILAVLLAAAILLRPEPPLVETLPEARAYMQDETEPQRNEDP